MQELSKVLACKYDEIVGKIDSFSDEYLNQEYKETCLKVVKKLFSDNENELKRGKSFSWAAGIVHAIGSVNNLFDSKEKPFIKAIDLYKAFGVSSSTGLNKSKEVRKLLNIDDNNKEWTVKVNTLDDLSKNNKNQSSTETFRFAVSKDFVRAQEIVDKAWHEKKYNSKVKLAKKALEVYEYCSDAYIILSNDLSLNDDEKRELLEKAVMCSEKVLRIDDLKNVDKRIFLLPMGKNFFGAKYTLARHLWKIGKKEEAIKHGFDILNYDSSDSFLMRGLLSSWLLLEERFEETRRLLSKYPKDLLAVVNYNKVALMYKIGDMNSAKSELIRAYKKNHFVVDYLIKRISYNKKFTRIYKIGTQDEAISYLELGQKIWSNIEMIKWLKEMKSEFDILDLK